MLNFVSRFNYFLKVKIQYHCKKTASTAVKFIVSFRLALD